jgi:hypothetical protein
MNTLSWLIYAAEVAGNLRGVVIAASLLSSGLIAVCVLNNGINADFGTAEKGSWMRPLRFLWVTAILAIVAAVMPTTRTIYMIAASEAGETVVTSPDAIEMMGDLKAIIKKRLKEELAPDGSK